MSTIVCKFDELAPNSATRFVIDGVPVAIVRFGDDVYAIGDTCSHAEVSLSEGEVWADEKTLECWKHGSRFDLTTGEPITLPATHAGASVRRPCRRRQRRGRHRASDGAAT